MNRRTRGSTRDRTAAPEHGLELALRARAHVRIHQPPLPAAREEHASRPAYSRGECFRIRLAPVTGVEDFEIAAAGAFEEVGAVIGRAVVFLVARRGHENHRGVRAAGCLDKSSEDRRIQVPAADHHERPIRWPELRGGRGSCCRQCDELATSDHATFSAIDLACRNCSR